MERDFEFARDADSLLSIDMFKDKLECFDLFHFGSATAFLEGELKKTYYKLKEYAVENNKLITFDANYRENLFADKKEEFIKCSVDFIKDSFIVKLSEEEALLIEDSPCVSLAHPKKITGKKNRNTKAAIFFIKTTPRIIKVEIIVVQD